MFIYAILGMDLFGYNAKFDSQGNIDMVNGSSNYLNFDSFLWAFSTVFVLLTEDSWSSTFYSYYRTCGHW